MKNLKRVLSLGLASVMLLGMMVVGASAKDFTDADKIVNDEAVQVLVALKVVNGKEDGSYFDPEGTVTRGEMAKMIAVAMNGGSEANTGVKGTPSFTDIGGHWAEGWIEYCADMGIIGGRGDGTFDPNGLVTGTEALKMVLTALGYDATAYKLTGAGWAAQTLENARKTGNMKLTEGLSNIVMTQPATRDTAAQMIWNGLQAYTVDITPDKNTSSGETTWSYGETTTTMLELRYNAQVETGVFSGNADYTIDGTTVADGEIYVDIRDNAGAHLAYWNFPAEMDIDYIGEEVKIVWKDGAKSIATNQADKNDEIFGVFVTGATRVERTTMDKVNDHKVAKEQIKLNGTVCDLASTVTVVTNYGAVANKTYNATGVGATGTSKGVDQTAQAAGVNSALTTLLKNKRGDAIKAVFNAANKVDTIYLTETVIGSVSSINSVNVAVQGVGTIKLSGNNVEEGLKKGDVVTVTKLYDSDFSKAESTVKKAEKVSGEVEAYGLNEAGNKTSNITLSGKKYNVYMETDMITVVDDDGKSVTSLVGTTANTHIGKDFDLYLVNGFVGAAVRTSADASNYSIITEVKTGGEADSIFTGLQLQVMGADGTKEIISVSKDSTLSSRDANSKVDAADYMVGDIVTYSFDKNDLADVTVEAYVGAAAAGIKYSDATKIIDGAVTAADCVFFAQTDSTGSVVAAGSDKATNAEWAAYNIRDLGDVEVPTGAAYTILYNTDTTKVLAVFVDLKGTPDGAADDTVYGIISAYNGRVADYYNYTVQSNGESYTIRTKTAPSATTLKKGFLVKFRPTADGIYGANAIKVFAATSGTNKIAIDANNIGYVEDFSARDNTMTYWYNGTITQPQPDPTQPNYDPNYTVTTGLSQKTYALAKDAAIIYIDTNSAKSENEASVDHWSTYSGFKNVMFTTKMVDDDEVINVMFVEVSTRKNVNNGIRA